MDNAIVNYWHVVYTRPRWEKKVATLLAKKNIEHYCPLNKVHRQWSDRKKIVEEPLFTSYVFVNIPLQYQAKVRETDGVLNFVYWLGKPAIIRHEEIDAIKKFLNDYSHVHLEKTAVNLHDKVRILNGPFISREGNVIEIVNKTVKILLPSMGYTLVAQVDMMHLEKMERTATAFAS